MERKFLGWLFIIILCAQAHETFSKHPKQEQEVKGATGRTGLDGERNGSRGYVWKKVKVFLRKGQHGRGSNGGANVVHHPRPQRSAAASLLKGSPFFMILTSILYDGLGFVIVFLF